MYYILLFYSFFPNSSHILPFFLSNQIQLPYVYITQKWTFSLTTDKEYIL